jgi:hypothetical protein
MTGEQRHKLAMVMRAFMSRDERWDVERYVDGPSNRFAYRLNLHGSVEIDASFMRAITDALGIEPILSTTE